MQNDSDHVVSGKPESADASHPNGVVAELNRRAGMPFNPSRPDATSANIRHQAKLAVDVIEQLKSELRFERSHVQALQKALMFWLPMVPDSPDDVSNRTGDDAMLLIGYEGDDEPSAQDLGWIRFNVSGADAVWPESLTPELADALGVMNFHTGPLAHLFRAAGSGIPEKCEQEQAFVLHWFAGLALKHGTEWRKHVGIKIGELRATIAKAESGISSDSPPAK